MNKQNLEDLTRDIDRQLQKKTARKRRRMKISGARLKELQKIIAK